MSSGEKPLKQYHSYLCQLLGISYLTGVSDLSKWHNQQFENNQTN